MITVAGTGPLPRFPTEDPEGRNLLRRRLFITDKNGVEHEISSQEELKAILAQMTPEERERWETNYRFSPIQNLTRNANYVGKRGDYG